jgi:hypothetical protein
MNDSSAAGSVVGNSRQIVYEFARAGVLEGWWVWALLIGSLLTLLYCCVRFYRRDVNELSRPIRYTLVGLRVLTILALVFFFLDLQRRTQRMVTRPSEVAVLVDTSQSMSLPSSSQASTRSRADRAAELLSGSDLLTRWEAEHRVSIYAFDDQSEPRLLETRGGDLVLGEVQTRQPAEGAGTAFATAGAVCLALALLLGFVSLMIGAAGRATSVGGWVAASALLLVIGIVCLGSVYCVYTDYALAEILSGQDLRSPDEQSGEEPGEGPPAGEPEPRRVADWADALAAAGSESRIGDAIQSVLTDHDPSTLAGIIVLTDGQGNGGLDANSAVATARRAEVAVYPVGLGSSAAPVNVRVVDLDAPRRVYPGDKFAVTAVLQGSGPQQIEVDVQLLDGLDTESAADGTGSPAAEVIDSQKVTVSNDGTLSAIRFELEPDSVGRRRLAVRVVPPADDRNEEDNLRDARYEVVSRKLRVMAIAGGPTREYRFVRNLLYRDNSTEVDVWLQTGRPGLSQDADRILDEFPVTAEELFKYDAIALFDPDWSQIDAASLELLDRWLSQQAGGMIMVAGPVFHPQWSRARTDPRTSKIAGFFPVNVSTRGALLGGGRQGGATPWPIQFTPEARRAEFLFIAEDPQESFEIWEDFGGVYDFVGTKTAKPGAKVYGYYSDPTSEVGGSLPIYFASQFYGAGRVYFQGSGEIWRLRGESDSYFDSYYTKLVRWVSGGRLLRDSNRGILLVDSTKAMVGDTITVRAVLTDEQFEPLDVPEVSAKLLSPGGRIDDIRLLPLEGEPRAGTYGGRFIVREAGSYELRLTLGDALDEQVLRQSVQVRLPTIELERPRRNDADMKQFAAMTGGAYLPVDESSTDEVIAKKLVSLVRPQPQTTVLPGTPDIDFSERRNVVLMWLIASMLTMEWVTRRLHRLA